jgi:hypothetical protein
MTSKRGGKAGARTRIWKGDAVEETPGSQAELAADRAEGNSPIPAQVEQERIRAPAAEQQPDRAQHRPPGAQAQEHKEAPEDKEDPEERIEETAEEHQARREAGERPPRGKL